MSTGLALGRAWRWFLVLTPLAVVLSNKSARAADAAPSDDVRTIQGKWEREEPSDSQASYRRATKEIRGSRETVTYYDAGGSVVRRHNVDFTLSRMGDVKIFTYTHMEITEGPQKGTKMPGPVSYIYWANEKFFREVWGFLPGQENPPVVLYVWKRAGGEGREANLAAAKQKPQAAKKPLAGTWKTVSAEHADRKVPDEEAGRYSVVFRDDTFRVERDGQMYMRGKFKLDDIAQPATIDLTVEEHADRPEEVGKVWRWVVEQTGEELKWCADRPGGERPAGFKLKEGSEQMLVVMKREKE